MMKGWRGYVFLVAGFFILLACFFATRFYRRTETFDGAMRLPPLPESVARNISLTGVWNEQKREFSGAAIFHDLVVLLPQYPDRCGNQIPAWPVKQLQKQSSIEPETILFDDDDLHEWIDGFEGFEAIAFLEDSVFVTIESHHPGGMMGHLVRGSIHASDSGKLRIKLDVSSRIKIRPRAQLGNMSDEAIVIFPNEKLLTIYEGNGSHVAPHPTACLFELTASGLRFLRSIPLPPIEYRITDCAPADESGKFWCINYMYPGDESKLNPARDNIATRWGFGDSHLSAWNSGYRIVERLVEMKFDGKKVSLTDQPPIYLKLLEDRSSRNWEAIAHLPGIGFFLATDSFPQTLFASITLPQRSRKTFASKSSRSRFS